MKKIQDENYDNLKSRIAQKEYCRKNDAPYLAPNYGFCYNCSRDIFSKFEREYINYNGETIKCTSGISIERAGKELVTSCPHCNITYRD